MNTYSLNDLCILNTRPTYQNAQQHLTKTLEHHGAEVIELPLQDILPLPSKKWLPQLPPIDQVDMAIFVSIPAVHCFFQGLNQAGIKFPAHIKAIAIGSATAKALHAHHIEQVEYFPEATSETLMTHLSSQISKQTILWIKGPHGRRLIGEQLSALGALVIELNVYESKDILYPPEFISKLWQSHQIHIILITSVKSLWALLAQVPVEFQQTFSKIHLLVLSERIQHEAQGLLSNPILVCQHDKILEALFTFNSVRA